MSARQLSYKQWPDCLLWIYRWGTGESSLAETEELFVNKNRLLQDAV